jgi:hypothetical protein
VSDIPRNDDRLLRNASRRGRYNVVCPMENARALRRERPEADPIVTPHIVHTPSIRRTAGRLWRRPTGPARGPEKCVRLYP